MCRICKKQKEILDHLLRECEGTKRENKTVIGILRGTKEGTNWMKEIIRIRKQEEGKEGARNTDILANYQPAKCRM